MDGSAASPTAGRQPSGISTQARRHNEMRRQVIARDPVLRDITGPDWRTVLALPVIFALHWSIAWLVSDASILLIFLAAFFAGQMLIHSAGALLHETAHKLVFRGNRAKLAFDLGLEAIMTTYAQQLTYQHEHISSHHPYIGDYERDYEHEDICALQSRMTLRSDNPRLQRLLTLLTLVLHALPFGVFVGDKVLPWLNARITGRPQQDPRRHTGATQPPVWQQRLFIAVSLATNGAMLLLLGPWALLYHLWALSLFLGKMGIWNLGQSLSEHAGSDDVNPTRSYYGWLNLILFNTGYHNEHHTFPNVAWTRLPLLKRRAPEHFTSKATKGYFGYWLDHVRGDFSASRALEIHQADHSERCSGAALG